MTTGPTTTRTLVIEKDLPHPPEKVWRALTEGPLLKQWLMENDFQPIAGHRFTFRSTPVPGWNGIIDCEVLAIEPIKELSYSWASMGLETTVAFTLTPIASGTRIRMEQSGFPQDGEQFYKGAQYGWQNYLGNLERVLASQG